MTISLKNTILWNPSKDIQSPNHAFNENTVLLLSRLAQAYEVHLVSHTNTSAEKKQICGLLRNAHIDSSKNLQESMVDQVHYCRTEQDKIQLMKRLRPSIHVEGGWEMEDGHSIIGQILNGIGSVNKLVWVVSNLKRKLHYQDEFSEADALEFTDNITHSSLARELGF
ncbi:hypothetical protein K501DRAFT_195232 [Backusella circina FSU 941]|nr:hypothetical protein K501DRAFT_195232 [Backusella circina FSU 941]